MNPVLNSHKSDEWETPKPIYDHYMNQGYFDPCPIKRSFDGLEIDWMQKNFVNPPYSQLKKWIEKAIKEHKKGKAVVLLIPARPSTKWFNKIFVYGAWIMFFRKRLNFSGKDNAPFPSMLVRLTGDQTEVFLEKNNG